MLFEDCAQRCSNAAMEFDEHERRGGGTELAGSIAYGLNVLRHQLYERAQRDVEEIFGQDSMLMPVSPVAAEKAVHLEIEIYLTAQSVHEAELQGFVDDPQWYRHWLGTLRMGETFNEPGIQERIDAYLERTCEVRSLDFSDALLRELPGARHIPLVLFRLFPLAVRIVTDVAFGDHFRANELRNQQLALLPAIADCHECHGKTLDNGEKCRTCGNPVWLYEWLTDSG